LIYYFIVQTPFLWALKTIKPIQFKPHCNYSDYVKTEREMNRYPRNRSCTPRA